MTKTPSDSVKNNTKQGRLPTYSIVLLSVALLSLIVVIIARNSVAFADFFNQYISALVRVVLARITHILPFSLAEALILLLPVILVLVIIYAVRHCTDSWKSILRYSVCVLSVASLIFSIFVFAYGIGYYVPPLEDRIDLDSKPSTVEELKGTALWLAEELKKYERSFLEFSDGATAMPYSFEQMNEKLMRAYEKISKKYSFIQDMNSRVKPVMSSIAMSYTHFTGFYTFFTGEANINVDFPDYTLPYTAAHELAHQRGIARENEANFIAFLVCITSDDDYLQYSGYLNLYEYVASALYHADKSLYAEVYRQVPEYAKNEMRAYSAFYDKYKDSTAGTVGSAINNAFLQANGNAEGTKSYGMVVDLAVAYHRTLIEN